MSGPLTAATLTHWQLDALPFARQDLLGYAAVGSHARALRRLWQWLRTPSPPVVAVVGLRGVGKTFTAELVAHQIREAGASVRWIRGGCLPERDGRRWLVWDAATVPDLQRSLARCVQGPLLVTLAGAELEAFERAFQRFGVEVVALQPWSDQEVAEALVTLWHRVSSRALPFTPRSLHRLAMLTGGVPRRVTRVVHDALMLAALRRADRVGEDDVTRAWSEHAFWPLRAAHAA